MNYNAKAARLAKTRTQICSRIGCHSKPVWWRHKAYGLCMPHYDEYAHQHPDQTRIILEDDSRATDALTP